ncbi:hypothetical protein G4B88_021569 [Cannabis sativa]|uniref:SSD domain-containing protein n=1 Tax=Cannabis sativa TaxID=3483 RepID=A0A7J6GIM2_CANSA|nr:hypothetical protein G4B88_021569 [Cannabis sativa]
MDPMNVSVYSCADTSLGCSCGDCPLSPACSNIDPPSPSKEDTCTLKFGPLKVRCIELSVTILYIVLISAFLAWSFSHRTRERRIPSSSVEPLLNVLHDEIDSVKGIEIVSQVPDGIQQPAVQKYMVARNPSLVLCSSLAIVLVLCVGLVRFNVETRPEKLWVGPGSRAAEEKQFFDSHLAPFYRIEQLIIATIPDPNLGKQPSIITEDNIQLLFEIQKKVDGIRANYSGSAVSLTDICMKPLGQDCATQSILQYYKMDPDNYDMYGGVEHAEYCFQHYTTADTCLSAFEAPLDPSTALGGFPGNNYSEASAFVVTYPVNNAVDKVGGENGRSLAWEKAFIKLAKEELLPMVHSSNLTLSFSSESSIEEELKRESTADVITIVVSYLVMFAYISVTLGDAPRLSSFYLSSKVLLGLSGVVLVMLSVLGSVGLFSALGVKSTLIIMEVIPFLVLAVGVDNMCILVHAVKRQSLELSIEQRISNALVEVGPSITLASLSEILAFAVGTLAVLLDFFLQVTAFVALIVFDFSRAEDNRIDCFPCIKIPSLSVDPSEGSSHRRTGLLTRYMEEVHAPILGIWAVKMVVIAIFLAFTLASIALSTRIEPGLEQQIVLPRDSYLQGYFDNLSKYLRVGPPLYFVVKDFNYSSQSRQTNKLCSISGCDSISLLNEISRASSTPESSYIAKPAASWLDDFLVWTSPEAFGCCRKFINGSYCPPDDQPPCCPPDESPCGLGGVCKDCTTVRRPYSGFFKLNWLSIVVCFRHSDLVNDRPSTAQFMEKLPWFLNALPSADCAKGGHGAYTNSVDLNGYESGIIQASEFRTYHTPVNKQADYVNSIKAAREFSSRVSASLKMQIFPYSVFYIFFEQYLDIWRIALTDIALALGAIFVVCMLITSSLWSSLIILLILAMIVVDLMGVMAILGIQLNAVSVVNLIMSIGIAVEFCVHITHAYLVSHGDRNQRMKKALSTMGASVFSGITLTKLVGVIVLYFSKSEIFVVYYFQMYLALVLIGFLHGLVFLPVVLKVENLCMDQATTFAKALLNNTNNPKLAWLLFKRTLSSPISTSSHLTLPSVPILARILVGAKMDQEIDSLHHLLLRTEPPETAHASVVSLLRILAKLGVPDKAVSQFKSLRLRFPDKLPSAYLYNLLLESSVRARNVDFVLWLYKDMVVSGVDPQTYTFNLLISALCDFGHVDDAREMFDKMRDKGCCPNEFSVGLLVRGYCRAGLSDQALEILDRTNDILPNRVVYNTLISSFCKEGFCKGGMLEEAKSLFESMKKKSDVMHLESYNIWLSALMRRGKLLEARLLLKEMVDQGIELSVCTYNIMIDGLCKGGMISDAKMVMGLMISSGISPDAVTYTTLLHGYCRRGKVFEANRVLQDMMMNNCAPNTHTCNILLHSLWKEGRTSEAEKLLQKMNERGYGIDTVTCNIVINGLCNNGKLDKAIEIVSGMWTHGRAALGHLGNSFIGLVDDSNNGKNCRPDLITYSIIISGLCKAGKLDEAKKKFAEMMGKKLHPDSVIYDTFIHSFCKEGKITSAFRVLKDMEKKGCSKSLQTYNSLILGLGGKNQIFEIYGLLDDMKEKGVSPDVCTYNNMISCLCEVGRIKDATSLLDEMLQTGISPNIPSFKILIKAFCKACEFEDVQEVFEIALSICGHKEALYSVMFNEFFLGGEVLKAKEIFEAALDRNLYVGNFLYKDLIDKLCKDEKLEEARSKHEADLLAERMMEMASEGSVKDKIYRRGRIAKKSRKSGGSDWQAIVHRNDGSGVALKTLKRVEKGWGRESILSSQPQHNEFHGY